MHLTLPPPTGERGLKNDYEGSWIKKIMYWKVDFKHENGLIYCAFPKNAPNLIIFH